MVQRWLLAAVAVLSMAGAASESVAAATPRAQDEGGPVTPFYGLNGGPVDPFYGAINPFYGGIDPANPASLAAASAEIRAAFFLNYYDRTMDLTGLDHVDWWMGAVHWSPALVKSLGTGTAHAGELDAWTTAKNADVQHINVVGGYTG